LVSPPIAGVFELLQKLGYSSVLDIPKIEYDEHERSDIRILRDAAEREGSFFDTVYLTELLAESLSYWEVGTKRSLLRAEWRNIQKAGLVSGDLQADILSDDEVETIFSSYRDEAPEYFQWQERSDLASDVRKRSPELDDFYDVSSEQLAYLPQVQADRHRQEFPIV